MLATWALFGGAAPDERVSRSLVTAGCEARDGQLGLLVAAEEDEPAQAHRARSRDHAREERLRVAKSESRGRGVARRALIYFPGQSPKGKQKKNRRRRRRPRRRRRRPEPRASESPRAAVPPRAPPRECRLERDAGTCRASAALSRERGQDREDVWSLSRVAAHARQHDARLHHVEPAPKNIRHQHGKHARVLERANRNKGQGEPTRDAAGVRRRERGRLSQWQCQVCVLRF